MKVKHHANGLSEACGGAVAGVLLTIATATTTVLGCQGESAPIKAAACVSGATQKCVCPGGEGAQACNAEGLGWDPCACEQVAAADKSKPGKIEHDKAAGRVTKSKSVGGSNPKPNTVGKKPGGILGILADNPGAWTPLRAVGTVPEAPQAPTKGASAPEPTARRRPSILQGLHKQLGTVSLCYEGVLARNPKATGTVTVKFQINTQGIATDVVAAGGSSALQKCAHQAVSAARFGPGAVTRVTYPYVFKPPADGGKMSAEDKELLKKGLDLGLKLLLLL